MLGLDFVNEGTGRADAGLFGGVATGADEDCRCFIAAAFDRDNGLSVGRAAEDLWSVAVVLDIGEQVGVAVEWLHGV